MHDEEELTAWHESGHAMMALLCGATLTRVTLEPPEDNGPNRYGDTVAVWTRISRVEIAKHEIKVSLAGPIVESIYRDDPELPDLSAEWSNDWETAWNAANQLADSRSKIVSLLNRNAVAVHRLFHQSHAWTAVSAIADELLAHQTLCHEEVKKIVEFWNRY